MHSSISVANKILSLARERDDTVTPMQLIKLVYLCHGWMLGLYGRALVKEHAQAWTYGPVYAELYHRIKDFRSGPILSAIPDAEAEADQFDDHEQSIISQVYEIYGQRDGITLSRLTHQPNSPWDITWNNKGKNSVISDDVIENHFRRLYESASNADD